MNLKAAHGHKPSPFLCQTTLRGWECRYCMCGRLGTWVIKKLYRMIHRGQQSLRRRSGLSNSGAILSRLYLTVDPSSKRGNLLPGDQKSRASTTRTARASNIDVYIHTGSIRFQPNGHTINEFLTSQMAYVYYDLHGNSIIGWSHYNIQLQVKHAVIHALVSVLHIMGAGKRGSIFNLGFLPDEKKPETEAHSRPSR